jgi:tripartite-type tricarboxylate transporter receptor subunit TctC
MPQIVEKLGEQGLSVVGGQPERLGAFVAQDIVKWQQVTREAGIVAE